MLKEMALNLWWLFLIIVLANIITNILATMVEIIVNGFKKKDDKK